MTVLPTVLVTDFSEVHYFIQRQDVLLTVLVMEFSGRL
jgi:hypothetical protein